MDRELDWRLARVAARLRTVRILWHGTAAALIVASAVATLAFLRAGHVTPSRGMMLATAIGTLASFALLAWSAFRRVSRRDVARRIERRFPELNACLLTAIDQSPDLDGRLGVLQRRVIDDALCHARRHDWRETVSPRRLFAALAAQGSALLVPFVVLSIVPVPTGSRLQSATPAIGGATASHDIALEVDPGDTSIERGTSLPVLARFTKGVPAAVRLVLTSASGESTAIPLTKSLDDPIFGGRIPNARTDFSYRIECDGHASPDYRVTVFDYPALERADATIIYPDWTGLPATKLEDVRRVSLPEGARLALSCRTNKALRLAEFTSAGTSVAQFTRPVESFAIDRHPGTSETLRLELTDSDGRTNREPIEFVIEVVPNRRPELKVTFPARDLRVSPLEEVQLEATAWDDFGLVECGLVYNVAGRPPVVVPLGKDHVGREPKSLSHLVELESLGVEPDDLVAWHFYATDRAADGAVRRTVGDIFFAEVRHFEEIFRQGQAPPGGGGPQSGGSQNEKKAEELAEQQKQIVTATWNVLRNVGDAASVGEPMGNPSSLSSPTANQSPSADLRTIHEAQVKLAAQAREFATRLNDARSRQHMKTALESMDAAIAHLSATLAQPASISKSKLPEALVAEQSAYQALLKLRAREHNVVESSGGGGGGGGSSRSQQQLDQLELTNQKNRYQTDKQPAKSEADPAKREQLQVLNRLRDLARRQADVNEKLRELDRALRDAKSAEEQAEIQRQLKMLRDEQQQALRDVDELRDRMDRPENQRQMSESREQLDQTRERVRQSSEALKEGQVSKALSSGVRAERDLDKLRDDFRKKTAHRFADDMQRLRQQARELSDKEQSLRQQLQPAKEGAKKSLRSSSANAGVEKSIAEQKRRVDDLLEGMKQVVEQAEPTEPLLSKQLYDAARTAREHQPSEQLDTAAKSVRQNRTDDALAAEKRAGQGIDALKRGIDRAADSVLGDETESLRRASDELSRLTNDVAKESPSEQSGAKSSSGRRQDSKPRQTADASAGKETQSRTDSPDASPSGQSDERPSDNDAAAAENSQKPGAKNSAKSAQAGSGESSREGSSGEPSGSGKSNDAKSANQPGSGGSPSAQSASTSGSKPDGSQRQGGQPGARGQSSGGSEGGASGGAGEGPGGSLRPMAGRDFQEWSDRLRDVEEMLSDPQLKADAARIRDRARSLRAEFKRHSEEPNWDLVRTTIVEPLTELQLRVAEELARRESKDPLAPIDRDPVPDRYSDLVNRYYERLGEGK